MVQSSNANAQLVRLDPNPAAGAGGFRLRSLTKYARVIGVF